MSDRRYVIYRWPHHAHVQGQFGGAFRGKGARVIELHEKHADTRHTDRTDGASLHISAERRVR